MNIDVVKREPAPQESGHPDIADLVEQDVLLWFNDSNVAWDIRQRKAFGVAKYGMPLRPDDGRNTLNDLYQELLDAAKYMRKLLYELSVGKMWGGEVCVQRKDILSAYQDLLRLLVFFRYVERGTVFSKKKEDK